MVVTDAFLCAYVRTPFGRYAGVLAGLRPDAMAAHVLRAIVERSGIDPNGNGTEAQIASSLQRLSDQMRQAQQALVAGGQPQDRTNTAESALNNVERLRRQIEALSGRDAGQRNSGQQGQGGQNQGRENYQTGALSRNGQPVEQGAQRAQDGQSSQGGQGAQGGQGNGPEVSNAKGEVKLWVTDGVLSKYKVHVTGTVSFNGNDREVDRTTTTEIKDVGSTKLDVPAEAKAKAGL